MLGKHLDRFNETTQLGKVFPIPADRLVGASSFERTYRDAVDPSVKFILSHTTGIGRSDYGQLNDFHNTLFPVWVSLNLEALDTWEARGKISAPSFRPLKALFCDMLLLCAAVCERDKPKGLFSHSKRSTSEGVSPATANLKRAKAAQKEVSRFVAEVVEHNWFPEDFNDWAVKATNEQTRLIYTLDQKYEWWTITRLCLAAGVDSMIAVLGRARSRKALRALLLDLKALGRLPHDNVDGLLKRIFIAQERPPKRALEYNFYRFKTRLSLKGSARLT